MKRTLAVAVLLVLAGCQKYIAVPNSAADRMWMITGDGTEVFRCWDLRNQVRRPVALCRRATMLGKEEQSPVSDVAEATATPSHPDSTEMPATAKP